MAVPGRGRALAALTALDGARFAPRGDFLPEEGQKLKHWGLPQWSTGVRGPWPLKSLRAKGSRPVAFPEEVSCGR